MTPVPPGLHFPSPYARPSMPPSKVELYAAIPHAYLWIIANAGHNPNFGEHAADFSQRALAFLRGEWDAG